MSIKLLGLLLRIEPQRLQRILSIGVPIIGGMLSQSLINLVDAAMVGRLGDVALAAVGLGGYASFVMVSMVMGLSSGVQTLVARHHGAGQHKRLHEPLMAGLLSAVILALPLSAFFILMAPYLIHHLTDNPDVAAIATPYFQWRAAATIAVAMNFVFRGYWSGIGETRRYLQTLLFMHSINIIVSYLLVFGIGNWHGIGAVGSGIGTALALVFGTALYSWTTFTNKREQLGQITLPTRTTLIQLGRLAWPNCAQQTLFALGISVLFWIIGRIGTGEQAIAHILISLQLMLILPAVGMGIAATSLVSHALGAGNQQDAYRWGWEVVRVAMFTLTILGIPLWLLPVPVLNLFTHEHNLIELGIAPLRLTGLIIIFEVTAMVLTQALLGAGASRKVLRINLAMQWGMLLPLAYLTGPVLGFGLFGIWLLQGIQRIGLSVIYSMIWRQRQWSRLAL
jgi:multidrug resistance protein, MATE family